MARQTEASQALAPCRQAAAASAPPASADWDRRDGVNESLPNVLATQAERANRRGQTGQSAAVAQAAARPTRKLLDRWDAGSQALRQKRSAATVASGDWGAAEPMQERSPGQAATQSLSQGIGVPAAHRCSAGRERPQWSPPTITHFTNRWPTQKRTRPSRRRQSRNVISRQRSLQPDQAWVDSNNSHPRRPIRAGTLQVRSDAPDCHGR